MAGRGSMTGRGSERRDGLRAPPFPVAVAGPSGAGKTTLCRRLVERRDDVRFSVSATTRAPRPGEVEGEDYLFLAREAFERMVREEELLEWAEVHGELYGTPRAELDHARAGGEHLLLDIDVQGVRAVRRRVPAVVAVFILPPTGERVLARLRRRGSEDEAALRRRLHTAVAELRSVDEFDYVVVNDDLEEAIRAIEAILVAESRRVDRIGEPAPARGRELADEIERVVS